jgi:Mg2+-importing ATPase
MFRSRPGRPLLVTTLVLFGVALALPYVPHMQAIGFVPLPPSLFAALVVITCGYVLVAELAKRSFYRHAD